MNKNALEATAADFLKASPYNYVSEADALEPEFAGMKIYEACLVGYAAADDAYLTALAGNNDARLTITPPISWLPSAKTVVSVFLSFTSQVKKSNRGGDRPSIEWLHARIQGQTCITQLGLYLRDFMIDAGYRAVVPGADERFWSTTVSTNPNRPDFTSNWSERHIAYAAGLGTFSLSKGIITEQGMAGRFVSFVTDMDFAPTPGTYTALTEHCIMCGKCAQNCPVGAINPQTGKSHAPCSELLDEIRAANEPYYGCGKCQVGVPCESGIPNKIARHPG